MFSTQLLEFASLYLYQITEYLFAYGETLAKSCLEFAQPVLEPVVLTVVFWGNKQWILAKHAVNHIYASHPVAQRAIDTAYYVWNCVEHVVKRVQCMWKGVEMDTDSDPYLYVFSTRKLEKKWTRSTCVSPSVSTAWLETVLNASDPTGGYGVQCEMVNRNNVATHISDAVSEEEEKECMQYAKMESENVNGEMLVILRADNKTYSRTFYGGKTEDATVLATKKRSKVEFLAIQFRTASETITIDLPTEFYLVNNHLFSGAFLYFYMIHGMQIPDFRLPETYTVYIMDDNIQQHELKPNQYVILRERGYEIHELYEKIE